MLCILYVILTYVKPTKEYTTFEFLKSIRLMRKRITFALTESVASRRFKSRYKNSCVPANVKKQNLKGKSLNSSHIFGTESSLSRIKVNKKNFTVQSEILDKEQMLFVGTHASRIQATRLQPFCFYWNKIAPMVASCDTFITKIAKWF